MRISLGFQVVIAILAGILTGLFFGSYTHFLEMIGRVYVMILQMAVLPYIPILLIHGLGSLLPGTARTLLRKGWIFFVLVWGISFGVVNAITYLIPTPELAFVNPQAINGGATAFNVINYLVPSNLFYDFANNLLPAITVFGLVAGLCLMHVEQKDAILKLMEQTIAVTEKFLYWMAVIAPIAIFSHVAAAAGTLQMTSLPKMELFFIVYLIGILFLTFWFLPILLSCLTKMRYREILKEFELVCLVPFATAMPSLAFPFILLALDRMAKRYPQEQKTLEITAQTVLPITFAFGQIGNFFIMYFVTFIAFFTYHPLTLVQKWILPLLTVPMSFGSVFTTFNAVLFFIQQFQLPDEAHRLFLTTTSITINFQVLLSVACVLTLTVLVLSAYYGVLQVRWKKLCAHLVIGLGALVLGIFLIKPEIQFKDKYTNLYMNLQIRDVMHFREQAKVYVADHAAPAPLYPGLAPMERVLKSGVLRVGYFPMDIPFSYVNKEGDLAGYDVAYAYQLANDLDVKLEFIPMELDRIGEQLKNAEFDVAMSALVMSEQRLTQMDFVQPYFEQNNVLIVPLSRKMEFSDYSKVSEEVGLRIGGIGAYFQSAQRHFPLAHSEEIADFQPLMTGSVDAVVWASLSAFVWCLSHPEFTVMDYQGQLGKRFFSYGVAQESDEWVRFLQNWMTLKEESGFRTEQYNYWILGQISAKEAPRWSILRNVLHWASTRESAAPN